MQLVMNVTETVEPELHGEIKVLNGGLSLRNKRTKWTGILKRMPKVQILKSLRKSVISVDER